MHLEQWQLSADHDVALFDKDSFLLIRDRPGRVSSGEWCLGIVGSRSFFFFHYAQMCPVHVDYVYMVVHIHSCMEGERNVYNTFV